MATVMVGILGMGRHRVVRRMVSKAKQLKPSPICLRIWPSKPQRMVLLRHRVVDRLAVVVLRVEDRRCLRCLLEEVMDRRHRIINKAEGMAAMMIGGVGMVIAEEEGMIIGVMEVVVEVDMAVEVVAGGISYSALSCCARHVL